MKTVQITVPVVRQRNAVARALLDRNGRFVSRSVQNRRKERPVKVDRQLELV